MFTTFDGTSTVNEVLLEAGALTLTANYSYSGGEYHLVLGFTGGSAAGDLVYSFAKGTGSSTDLVCTYIQAGDLVDNTSNITCTWYSPDGPYGWQVDFVYAESSGIVVQGNLAILGGAGTGNLVLGGHNAAVVGVLTS